MTWLLRPREPKCILGHRSWRTERISVGLSLSGVIFIGRFPGVLQRWPGRVSVAASCPSSWTHGFKHIWCFHCCVLLNAQMVSLARKVDSWVLLVGPSCLWQPFHFLLWQKDPCSFYPFPALGLGSAISPGSPAAVSEECYLDTEVGILGNVLPYMTMTWPFFPGLLQWIGLRFFKKIKWIMICYWDSKLRIKEGLKKFFWKDFYLIQAILHLYLLSTMPQILVLTDTYIIIHLLFIVHTTTDPN